MPLHKARPWGRKPCGGNRTEVTSSPAAYSSTNTDKSSQAAMMAQQLASQSSWADTYAPGTSATPATTATPAESVTDTESQLDVSEPPPSYEDARLERELPAIPQSRQENVRQEPVRPIETPPPNPSRDLEAGASTPLLYQDQDVVKLKKRKKRLFVIVFLIIAVWLIGIQAFKGAVVDFWRADGTPIPPFPHRDYSQHETSTAISGTFTFYDSLDLSTTSGSINIVVDPQPSDKVGVIRVASRSGSIRMKFTDEYIKSLTASGLLDRTYDIEIRSSSGSQTIELPQGNGGVTSITSESGSQHIKLHMTRLGKDSNSNATTTLTTKSASGSQQIKIKSLSAEPITSLASRHYSTGSGSITMKLPSIWEGMVHASIGGSGLVDVKGENLKFQRNGSKEVYAWRVGQDEKRGQVIEVRVDGSGSIRADCSAS